MYQKVLWRLNYLQIDLRYVFFELFLKFIHWQYEFYCSIKIVNVIVESENFTTFTEILF